MVRTGRSIVITLEATKSLENNIVKSHNKFHFEFVNELKLFLLFIIQMWLNQMNEQ